MKKIKYPERENWSSFLKRPTQEVSDIEQTVLEIFNEIKSDGNTAVHKYTKRFDGVQLDDLMVSEKEFNEAEISEELKKAIQVAKGNIERFHNAQKTDKVTGRNNGRRCLLARKATHSKSGIVYSRRYCTFIFNHFNACHTCNISRMQRNYLMHTTR